MDGKRVFVAGHNGMVGSAICRELARRGDCEIVNRSREQLDLRNQLSVQNFFESERIDEVFLAAAKVGGIYANSSYPFDFIYDNLMIQSNVINSAFRSGVKKLLFLGSSCIYPRLAAQPLAEESLLSGALEPTNAAYAIAKIAGLKLCESLNKQYSQSLAVDYRSVMPTNLYGPGDNYDSLNSHVIPGLIGRFHEAKLSGIEEVKVWGTGLPLREFLYVDDLARAAIHTNNMSLDQYKSLTTEECDFINVGSGEEITIHDLAYLIANIVGYQGIIQFDQSFPDGTPRKILDSKKIRSTGWEPIKTLRTGLQKTYEQYELARGIVSQKSIREDGQ